MSPFFDNIIKKIKSFWKGYESFSVHERPKTFWRYLIYYPLNWTWTLGSILFIVLFIKGGVKYESPILYYLSSIPFVVMIYNLIDEYYAFQWYRTGFRKVSARTLINLCTAIVTLILLSAITLMFVL